MESRKSPAAVVYKLALASLVAMTAIAAGALQARLNAQDAGCSTEQAKADLSDEDTQALYDCISDSLLAGYEGSGVASASAFRNWTKASTAPFVSSTHGGRFVIHYANDVGAAAYMRFEDIGSSGMPAGSVAAKESFNVNDEGEVVAGPLFLMTKVEKGRLPDTADWRYSLVLPNGAVMGTTGGENGDKVAFCHTCHAATGAEQDALLFPKEGYRVTGG